MENPSSFSKFGSLPPEIRNLIWTATLPQEDEPAIAAFGLAWVLPWLDPNNTDEDFRGVSRKLVVQMPMPTAAFVCHESRAVVLRWLDSKPNVARKMREETQTHVYVRDFDEEKDLMYIPRDKWDMFSTAFISTDPDVGVIQSIGASIRHLALPAFTAYYSIATLGSMLEYLPNLNTIHVIWGELPQLRRASRTFPDWPDHIAEVQPRWEMHEVPWEADVKLCFVDPEDGSVTYEQGDLETYQEEMDEQWAFGESVPPSRYVDEEFGTVNMPYKHITIKEFRCPEGGQV